MSLARKQAGPARRGRPVPAEVLRPRPRSELLDLSPLDRVLAQLEAMGLDYQRNSEGYAAQCPHHRSDLGRLNFEIIELDEDRPRRDGTTIPAGTVLLYCQAYGGLNGTDGCSQDKVIEALGLLPRDLFPDGQTKPVAERRSRRRHGIDFEDLNRAPLDEATILLLEEKSEQFEADIRGRARSRLGQLSDQLGLPEVALGLFHVGWRSPDYRQVAGDTIKGHCWTIPERDGSVRITAINRRYESGEKRVMAGGRRGLCVPDG
jgi:hypothetical protein